MERVIKGNIVDHHNREIFKGSVVVKDGIIAEICCEEVTESSYIMCGFIDSHIHIESSMVTPEEFGKAVISRGTVAVVTDPHEIANVMGVKGIEFMVENSRNSPIKTFFTIPSSVPATPFDVTGGTISVEDTEKLASSGKFVALSEMMNVPGVIYEDSEVMAKIAIAQKYNLPIDGHAPLVIGEDLKRYIGHGITTDHECFTIDEAREKLSLGMNILIRDGSAAQNFNTLSPLIASHPDNVMFCFDDGHIYDIISNGHIDMIIKRSLALGYDIFDLLKIASTNTIKHYKLDVGDLKIGDKADFIVVDNLTDFNIEKVFIDGNESYNRSYKIESTPPSSHNKLLNCFNHTKISKEQLIKVIDSEITIIKLIDNEIVTTPERYTPSRKGENLESDVENDILKIVYINRYTNGTPQITYCKGFNLKGGAIASTISHDSHNIIAIGCSDSEITDAVNAIIETKGGIAICHENSTELLPLKIGGIISDLSGDEVAKKHIKLRSITKEMGCSIASPIMTLSFMSLVVIPEVKIGEKGLFSYSKFDWIEE